jgi:hypothetical protein
VIPYEREDSKPVVNPKQLLHENLDEASQAHREPCQDEEHSSNRLNLRATIRDGLHGSEVINKKQVYLKRKAAGFIGYLKMCTWIIADFFDVKKQGDVERDFIYNILLACPYIY